MKFFRLLPLCFCFAAHLLAQRSEGGAVMGTINDHTSQQPVENATIVVTNKGDGKTIASGVTDAKGGFALGGIPDGSFDLTYSLVGADTRETTAFTVDTQHRAVDLGALVLGADAPVKMQKMEVSTNKDAF